MFLTPLVFWLWAGGVIMALGTVIASVTSDPRIFVSGGTEHQCPPGQAPIAVIVRLETELP